MGFYTCGLGDASASQNKNSNDVRMDGHGTIISTALLVLLFWGHCWILPEGCMGHQQASFGKWWLLLFSEFHVLPVEDPEMLLGAKPMVLTCQ